jgi:hypothetical protein
VVKPKDFLEQIWIRDVVDLTWDSLRMGRVKATLLTSVKVERPDGGMESTGAGTARRSDGPLGRGSNTTLSDGAADKAPA